MSIEFPLEPSVPNEANSYNRYVPGIPGIDSGFDDTQIHEPVARPPEGGGLLVPYVEGDDMMQQDFGSPTSTEQGEEQEESSPVTPQETAQAAEEPEMPPQPDEVSTHAEEAAAEAEPPHEIAEDPVEVIVEDPEDDPNDIEDAIIVDDGSNDAPQVEQPSMSDVTSSNGEVAPALPEVTYQETEAEHIARLTQVAEEINASDDYPYTVEVADDGNILVTLKEPVASTETPDLPGLRTDTEIGVMQEDGTWEPGKNRDEPIEERHTLVPSSTPDEASVLPDAPSAYVAPSEEPAEYDEPPEVETDPDEGVDTDYEPSEPPETEPEELPEVDDTLEPVEETPEETEAPEASESPEATETTATEEAKEVAEDPRVMEQLREILSAMMPGKPDTDIAKDILSGFTRMLLGFALAPIIMPGVVVKDVTPVKDKKHTYYVTLGHKATLGTTLRTVHAPSDKAAAKMARWDFIRNGQQLV